MFNKYDFFNIKCTECSVSLLNFSQTQYIEYLGRGMVKILGIGKLNLLFCQIDEFEFVGLFYMMLFCLPLTRARASGGCRISAV